MTFNFPSGGAYSSTLGGVPPNNTPNNNNLNRSSNPFAAPPPAASTHFHKSFNAFGTVTTPPIPVAPAGTTTDRAQISSATSIAAASAAAAPTPRVATQVTPAPESSTPTSSFGQTSSIGGPFGNTSLESSGVLKSAISPVSPFAGNAASSAVFSSVSASTPASPFAATSTGVLPTLTSSGSMGNINAFGASTFSKEGTSLTANIAKPLDTKVLATNVNKSASSSVFGTSQNAFAKSSAFGSNMATTPSTIFTKDNSSETQDTILKPTGGKVARWGGSTVEPLRDEGDNKEGVTLEGGTASFDEGGYDEGNAEEEEYFDEEFNEADEEDMDNEDFVDGDVSSPQNFGNDMGDSTSHEQFGAFNEDDGQNYDNDNDCEEDQEGYDDDVDEDAKGNEEDLLAEEDNNMKKVDDHNTRDFSEIRNEDEEEDDKVTNVKKPVFVFPTMSSSTPSVFGSGTAPSSTNTVSQSVFGAQQISSSTNPFGGQPISSASSTLGRTTSAFGVSSLTSSTNAFGNATTPSLNGGINPTASTFGAGALGMTSNAFAQNTTPQIPTDEIRRGRGMVSSSTSATTNAFITKPTTISSTSTAFAPPTDRATDALLDRPLPSANPRPFSDLFSRPQASHTTSTLPTPLNTSQSSTKTALKRPRSQLPLSEFALAFETFLYAVADRDPFAAAEALEDVCFAPVCAIQSAESLTSEVDTISSIFDDIAKEAGAVNIPSDTRNWVCIFALCGDCNRLEGQLLSTPAGQAGWHSHLVAACERMNAVGQMFEEYAVAAFPQGEQRVGFIEGIPLSTFPVLFRRNRIIFDRAAAVGDSSVANSFVSVCIKLSSPKALGALCTRNVTTPIDSAAFCKYEAFLHMLCEQIHMDKFNPASGSQIETFLSTFDTVHRSAVHLRIMLHFRFGQFNLQRTKYVEAVDSLLRAFVLCPKSSAMSSSSTPESLAIHNSRRIIALTLFACMMAIGRVPDAAFREEFPFPPYDGLYAALESGSEELYAATLYKHLPVFIDYQVAVAIYSVRPLVRSCKLAKAVWLLKAEGKVPTSEEAVSALMFPEIVQLAAESGRNDELLEEDLKQVENRKELMLSRGTWDLTATEVLPLVMTQRFSCRTDGKGFAFGPTPFPQFE